MLKLVQSTAASTALVLSTVSRSYSENKTGVNFPEKFTFFKVEGF